MKRILVTGAPRSGTTFLGEMINLSKNVLYIWEPFNSNFRKGINYYYPYCGDSTNQKKRDYLLEIIKNTLDLKNLRASIKINNEDNFIKSLVKKIGLNRTYFRYLRTKTKYFIFKYDFILIKDPVAIFLSELLISEFDFQVIISVRKPEPIIKSRLNLGWDFDFIWWLSQEDLNKDLLSNSLYNSENFYEDNIAKAAVHWNIIYNYAHMLKQRYPKNVKIVLQENIQSNPIGEFKSLYNYLGLSFKNSIKEKINRMTNGSRNVIQTKNVAKIKKRNLKTVNEYKGYFKTSDLSIIREITKRTKNLFYDS